MRTSIRRFTRLTNAFSKKVENRAHAVSLHFMFYDFARIHKTLRLTPAMAAGVTDHVWSLEEMLRWDEGGSGRNRTSHLMRGSQLVTRLHQDHYYADDDYQVTPRTA